MVCWASGLLEVLMDKDVQPDGGPIVIMHGTAGKLRQQMTAHGVYIDKLQGWYVPGAQDVATMGHTALQIERARMQLVVAFGQRLRRYQAKNKGLKHVKAMKE